MEAQDQGPFAYENWRAALAGEPLRVAYEYPLFTDSRIIGNDLVDGYGPYQLINTVAVKEKGPTRPNLILRVEHHLSYKVDKVISTTEEECYHGGLLQDEIAALLSICLGIRLKAGGETRLFDAEDQRGRPIAWGFAEDPVVPQIPENPVLPVARGEHHLETATLLKSLTSLSPRDAIVLVRAARLYQEAVWIVEFAPELSWIMFTSAIETVADRWRTANDAPVERLRLSRPALEQLLLQHGGEEFVQQVAEEIAPYMGATKKFVDFVLEFLPEPPEQRPPEWAQHPWDPRSMKASMRRIYGYRSRALHGGHPFPAPMCMGPHRFEGDTLAEKPIGFAMGTRGATWAVKDTPMLLHTFEYIVRKSILKWWEKSVRTPGES